MAASKKLKGAGLTGAGVVGGLAGWATVNRLAARRYQRVPDDVPADLLEMPDDVTTRVFTVSDGWKVRVIERGPEDGQPVVLLHGITLSAEIWPYQMADLPGAGFRVLAFDLRGHGGSARIDHGGLDTTVGTPPAEGTVTPATAPHADRMTITRLAMDVEEVLAQLDLHHVILVGHSMGGMVALRMMARDRPTRTGRGRVAALALIASSANATRRRGLPGISEVVALTRPLIARGAALAARLPGPTLPANDLAFLLARVTFGNGSSARQVLWTGEMASHVPVGVSGELLLNILRFDEEDRLGSIRIPTTVVVGDHDLMTPLAQSELLARGIPGAELIDLAGCGHMVMLERPKELDEAIIALADRAASGTVERAAPVITDVTGVRVGHWSDPVARTGCTVVLLPAGTVASGEVRGGAPGTREWALLDPGRRIDRVNAVVLTGGSAFGLAACDGVVRWCEERGVGWPTSAGPVPIVVGMVIYDLAVGDAAVRPGAADGYAACVAARAGSEAVGSGRVGAGAGATFGKWRGPETPSRDGGLGSATVRHGDLVVAALVVVNAVGEPVDRDRRQPRVPHAPAVPPAGENTTIGIVVTNAKLSKSDCLKAAEAGHDGLARALDPAHTFADGDAIVVAATGEVDPGPGAVAALSAWVVEQAILAATGPVRS